MRDNWPPSGIFDKCPAFSSRLHWMEPRCLKGGASAIREEDRGSYPSPLVKSYVAREATIKGRHSFEAGIRGIASRGGPVTSGA